jgi:hypothetical protein
MSQTWWARGSVGRVFRTRGGVMTSGSEKMKRRLLDECFVASFEGRRTRERLMKRPS